MFCPIFISGSQLVGKGKQAISSSHILLLFVVVLCEFEGKSVSDIRMVFCVVFYLLVFVLRLVVWAAMCIFSGRVGVGYCVLGNIIFSLVS
jgi:hypothetical protein